ncbi:hypothetical protein WJ58_01370 [Burkholderia ubonensis]|nr:porin [Burkholderia ubonensis]KVM46641.1 hypothetical protein WJ58_01370 [Burkholderia ubonensis]
MKSRTWTICVALLGATASTSGFAQGSVTLYGNLDTALLYTSKTLDSATGHNAGHQFAMTGAEDLGGGLEAIFKLST